VIRLFDERQAADARADTGADLLAIQTLQIETRVGDGFDRCGEPVMDERVEPARLLRRLPTSKPFTSPAICDENGVGSKRVMRVMPDFPARMLDQASDTPTPTGATMPRPVTTTLRLAKLAPIRRCHDFP